MNVYSHYSIILLAREQRIGVNIRDQKNDTLRFYSNVLVRDLIYFFILLMMGFQFGYVQIEDIGSAIINNNRFLVVNSAQQI